MDITQVVYNPTITPIVAAIAGSLTVLGMLFWKRAAIAQAIGAIRPKLLTRSGFFWSSIFVFMAVSVIQAGAFFSISGNAIGFAVAFFLDLVTVVLMHAQLESRYRGENGRANLFIFFIILTCGMSTYANLAISQNDFSAAKMLPHASPWVQNAAPYALASFPLFVIMMSIAAEKIVNVRPLDKLKEEEYEADEQKRVRILEIRNQYALEQAQLSVNRKLEIQQIKADQELRQQQIKAQRQAQRNAHKVERTFFLVTWLFPKDPLNMQAVVAAVTEEVKKAYDQQLTGLNQQVSTQIRKLGEQASANSLQFQKEIQSHLNAIQTDHQTLVAERSSTGKQLSALTRQIELITESNGRFQHEIESTLSTTISKQIATAFQSYNIPDETTIAEQIATAIQEYTVDQTDDNSVPIDSKKPLYPFMTEELKQVVIRYPNVDSWIRAGQRTVSVSDIVAATNLTVQFVGRQASDGMFTGTQTKNIYTTKSVINWLKTNPSPQKRATKKREQITEEIEAVSQENLQNTEAIPAAIETQNGHTNLSKKTVKLDEYAELMGVM